MDTPTLNVLVAVACNNQIAYLLKPKRFAVDYTMSSSDAKKMIQQKKYDFGIIELELGDGPKDNRYGTEVAEILRAANPDAHILGYCIIDDGTDGSCYQCSPIWKEFSAEKFNVQLTSVTTLIPTIDSILKNCEKN